MKTTKEQRETILAKIDILNEDLIIKKDIVRKSENHLKEMFYIDIMLIEIQLNALRSALINDNLDY
jgi:hypothetical protein